jgi:hypothetical protein
VEEFHGQFKIGGGKKKGVLLDWRGNEKKKKKLTVTATLYAHLYCSDTERNLTILKTFIVMHRLEK